MLKIFFGCGFYFLIGFALLGCESDVTTNPTGSTGSGGTTSNCTTTFNLTGTWRSTYTCSGTAGNFPGEDTLTVNQTGTAVTYTDQSGGSFSGTLCDSTFTWTGSGSSYTENGTWTITDANNFTKTSTFTRTDGSGSATCTGTGVKQ